MTYLKRKADLFLAEWKADSNRKPLMIRGARQVGKTETIRRFGENNFGNFIEINFYEEPKYKVIIRDGYGAADIIKNISLIDPSKRFIENETLIFFDDIQDFPEIATSLKFFDQDGRFDVICSGSLLGIHYKRIESNSVGYKTNYEMNSLDFEEFLWALHYREEQIDSILIHMLEQKPFNQLELDTFNRCFLDFSILGGMPAVVRDYIDKGTFEGSLDMQRQLLIDYEDDVRKYAEGLDKSKIINVFRHIPVQLAKDNKKFQISKVAKGARSKDYIGCIDWLNDAGIINICYCMSFPELPLKGNYDSSKYKIYMRDSGLLVSMLDEESQDDLRVNKDLGVYKGALYENIVGDALVKEGYQLYYYKREDSTLEQDFFVRTKRSLVPVEVKANNNRAKSLITLIKSEKYSDVQYGIKLCNGNIGFNNSIYTFPYFCTFMLKKYLAEQDW